jgi:hypothetical protein
MKSPYTIFGETKMVEVVVYKDGKRINETTWETELWVERGEDYYAMMSPQLKGKNIRIIDRELWLRSLKA